MSGLDVVKSGQNVQGSAIEGKPISESDAETLALFASLFIALQPDQSGEDPGVAIDGQRVTGKSASDPLTGDLPVAAELMARSALDDSLGMQPNSLDSQAGDTRLSNEEVMAFLSDAPSEDVDGLTRLLVVASNIIGSAEANVDAPQPTVMVMDEGLDAYNPQSASDVTTAAVVQALSLIKQADVGVSPAVDGISLSDLSAIVAAQTGNDIADERALSQQPRQPGVLMPSSPQFVGPMPMIAGLSRSSQLAGPMPRATVMAPSPAFVGPMPLVSVPSESLVAAQKGLAAAVSQPVTRDKELSQDGLFKGRNEQLAVKSDGDSTTKPSTMTSMMRAGVIAADQGLAKQASEQAGRLDRVSTAVPASATASASGASTGYAHYGPPSSGGQEIGSGLGQGTGQHTGQQAGSQGQSSADFLPGAGRDLAGRIMEHRLNMGRSGWPENMIRQLNSNLQSGAQSIRIILEPRQLGRLNVELGLRNGRASIRVAAETAEAARRLASARGQLGMMLDNAGLRLASFQTSSADLFSGADGAGGNATQQDQAGRDGESSSRNEGFSNIINEGEPADLPDDALPRADETAVLSILA